MSPHTDAGALLKLADGLAAVEIEDDSFLICLTPQDHKTVVMVLRQAASQGSAGGEVTQEMLVAAMRAFEPLSSVLRYREKDKWHTCDMMAMREAIKAVLSFGAAQAAQEPTAAQIDAALNAWFKSPPSETDQGLERSMKAALIAASLPLSAQRGNRFCKQNECRYPDCLVQGGICGALAVPSAVPSAHQNTPKP